MEALISLKKKTDVKSLHSKVLISDYIWKHFSQKHDLKFFIQVLFLNSVQRLVWSAGLHLFCIPELLLSVFCFTLQKER